MSATLTWNGEGFARELEELSPLFRQAGATAINRTIEEGLKIQRDKMRAGMAIRSPNFILPPVQLPSKWRATASRLEGLMAMGDDDGGAAGIGPRRVALLTKFEKGKARVWGGIDKPLYVPTRALRPTPSTVIPRALYPRNLRVLGRMIPNTQGAGMQYLGPKAAGVRRRQTVTIGKLKLRQQDRTFVMGDDKGAGPKWGVYERFGPGKGDIRMLWSFRARTAGRKLLNFQRDAEVLLESRFPINISGAWELAVAGRLTRGRAA